MKTRFALLIAVSAMGFASPAVAKVGDPIALGDDASLDIIANARLRYEMVEQDNAADDANAVTLRGRLGAVLKVSQFEFLAEGEGTVAILDDYNDTLPGNGVEPFSVVADPENIELNRLQVEFKQDNFALTVGRQRIIYDNARFVGNVGWRQNEQTFDAARAQATFGPVKLDATYSISQRTIFGNDSPNEHFDGDILLLNGSVKAGVVNLTAFGYLIDYDTRVAFSSQTWGVLATATIPAGPVKILGQASFATQEDMGENPTPYSAEYYNLELGLGVAGFTLKAGYEELGSDGGVAAFQTPLATVHAFNGWADLFLTTPVNGIRDYYGSLAKGFAVPGVTTFNAMVVYHEFDSDFGSMSYGSEIDAQVGFKVGPVGLLVKYANYDADEFGVDTEKVWLQAEYSF